MARNSYGVIDDEINAQVPASSTLVVECLALRLGSHLIERQGWQHVFLESDCKLAIEMVNRLTPVYWESFVPGQISTVDLDMHQRSRFDSTPRVSWLFPSIDATWPHQRPTMLPFHVAPPPMISIRPPASSVSSMQKRDG
ncbi:hypothetical protein V6N13_068325 [Hibiscus sabdariffa]